MLNEIEKSNPIIGKIVASGAGLDTDRLMVAALLIVLAVLMRRPLAALLAAIIARVCAAIGVKLSDGMRAEIKTSSGVLVVACEPPRFHRRRFSWSQAAMLRPFAVSRKSLSASAGGMWPIGPRRRR